MVVPKQHSRAEAARDHANEVLIYTVVVINQHRPSLETRGEGRGVYEWMATCIRRLGYNVRVTRMVEAYRRICMVQIARRQEST
uniref:Uncharacterized protein n=1 Tax=Leersia perrieri TaxID=77586 RepID=A0A0D9XRU1_9ORYZ